MADRYGVTDVYPMNREYTVFSAHMTDEAFEKFKNYPSLDTIIRVKGAKGQWNKDIFPYDQRYPFNNTNFGPIYIPEAGKTVTITPESIPFYKRIIEVYEGSEMGIQNEITQSGTQVLLNGEPISEYTFKMDYYWMMGDNRDNSQDARAWGYVPYNHVVGKPVFIWMSWENGIFKGARWKRFFTTVGGDGQPVSYLKYFLILLAGWFVFNFFRKKKKKA